MARVNCKHCGISSVMNEEFGNAMFGWCDRCASAEIAFNIENERKIAHEARWEKALETYDPFACGPNCIMCA